MQVRRANVTDLMEMQHCNLRCLPENYSLRFYYYHLLSWPQLLYVQKDYNDKTVGYVLSKMDDEEKKDEKHGHITSLAVLRTHRKLGIASRLMRLAMKDMDEVYDANYCSLHVRNTNEAALHLYQDTLHFRCNGIEESYYVDKEDAYHMKRYFGSSNPGHYVDADRKLIRKHVPKAFETSLNGKGPLFSSLRKADSAAPVSGGKTSQVAAAETKEATKGKKPAKISNEEQLIAQLLAEEEKTKGKDKKKGRK